jgi:hypothetical protein
MTRNPDQRVAVGVSCHYRKGKYIKERDTVSFKSLAFYLFTDRAKT